MDKIKNYGVSRSVFGMIDGQGIELYTLTNSNGNYVSITNYGGIVTGWTSKDKNGVASSIVVGFNSLSKYLPNGPYFGALVGRYANRIARGKFSLNDNEYVLACNNHPNHLHGGKKGFDKAIWNAEAAAGDEVSLLLRYRSEDGEEGYPGNLSVSVKYSFTKNDELEILYAAETDQATPLNLTNHCYFNLTCNVDNTILNHTLTIHADNYTPFDSNAIPTGEIVTVEHTPFNFKTPKQVGEEIKNTDGGYDNNYVLNERVADTTPVAVLTEAGSGRKLEVFTDQPGMQFYTGNYLDGTLTTDDGKPINKQSALCLETQHFPDSPNHPSFPRAVLHPGERFTSFTRYKLSLI